MSYDWQISPGDTVKVYMTADEKYFLHGTVKSMPQATGDAWIIDQDGVTVYVQTYAKIVRTRKSPF